MTASQFTGGSFKHVDPSNYQSGKSGSEVTIHWCVADGADEGEQIAMGERARVEAIRLAMGTDRPYQQAVPSAQVPEPVVPPTQPPVAATLAIIQSPVATAQAGPIAAPAASLSETEVITDEALRGAAGHHQQRILTAALQDPVSQETAARKISGLIAQFVLPPKTLYTIDQAQRRQFLDGLAAL